MQALKKQNMAPKRQAKTAVEFSHDDVDSIDEAILRRIEGKLDIDALREDLVEQVATKLTDSIRMEDMVELFVERKRVALSADLAEHILGSVLRFS